MQVDMSAGGGLPDFSRLFDRPLIILAAPRSGSTLLFETLAECADLWSIGGESHRLIESIPDLNPAFGKVDSNRLTAEHAAGKMADLMRRRFARMLRNRDGLEFFKSRHLQQLRFLEKTPKNALRIPFMETVFPNALYVFLVRDARANISSMMEAWRSGRWVTYPKLKDWQGPPWSLLLPPGWQSMNGKSVEEICAFQWAQANRIILQDLKNIPAERWLTVRYEDLLEDSESTVNRICEFAGLSMDERLHGRLNAPLPLSRFTQTRPSAEKWRKNEGEILSVLDSVSDTERQLEPLGYRRQN